MFLTDRSRDAYFTLQVALSEHLAKYPWHAGTEEKELDQPAFENIRKLGSDLRTALVLDLGTRRTDAPAK
jgi:hypothetical protein